MNLMEAVYESFEFETLSIRSMVIFICVYYFNKHFIIFSNLCFWFLAPFIRPFIESVKQPAKYIEQTTGHYQIRLYAKRQFNGKRDQKKPMRIVREEFRLTVAQCIHICPVNSNVNAYIRARVQCSGAFIYMLVAPFNCETYIHNFLFYLLTF